MFVWWLDLLYLIACTALVSFGQFLVVKGVWWAREHFAELLALLLHYFAVIVWFGMWLYLVTQTASNLSVLETSWASENRGYVFIVVMVVTGFPYYLLFSRKHKELKPYGGS
ncbi:MAG: hypothetical protein JJ977_08340 [Kordiimonadaceae bacterium]|nr:hypothetical protein [Kordiimonadaceae bacterium]